MKRSVFATMTLLPGLAMAHLSNMPAVEHAAEHAGTAVQLAHVRHLRQPAVEEAAGGRMVLAALMLLGRLSIYPVLLVLGSMLVRVSPWRRR